jgi:hypothetical protein
MDSVYYMKDELISGQCKFQDICRHLEESEFEERNYFLLSSDFEHS